MRSVIHKIRCRGFLDEPRRPVRESEIAGALHQSSETRRQPGDAPPKCCLLRQSSPDEPVACVMGYA